jgi:hypothetical protein
MHVDVNGRLDQRALGTRAGREVWVRWCIQKGKAVRRMRERMRRDMVVGVRIVERSADRMLEIVSV